MTRKDFSNKWHKFQFVIMNLMGFFKTVFCRTPLDHCMKYCQPSRDFFLSLFMISSKEAKKLNKFQCFFGIIFLDAKMSVLISVWTKNKSMISCKKRHPRYIKNYFSLNKQTIQFVYQYFSLILLLPFA